MNLFHTPQVLTWIYPDLIWHIPTGERKIFLTFDDGPIPGPTEFVLDVLKQYQAKATFFCIGDNIRKHPLVFERIHLDGHLIGNHTFNHLKGWGCSVGEYVQNISLCDDAIGFHDNQKKLFRPPYGRIKRSQIAVLKKDYKIIMWDVLTHDYAQSISPDNCLKGSIKAARPGSIVVFHDSLKAKKNMAYTLPRLLDHFSCLGYKFESLTN